MLSSATVLLAVLIFLASALYSSVGHAGASGDLAAMALMGVAPAVMKPTPLVLNIFVASIATWKFSRAGYFSWPLFWPFPSASVPFAFLGGSINLPGRIYTAAVGVLLLYAAVRLFQTSRSKHTDDAKIHIAPLWAALLTGAVIGILSGF